MQNSCGDLRIESTFYIEYCIIIYFLAKKFKKFRKFKKSHKRHIFRKIRKRRKITKIKRIITENTPYSAPKTPEHAKTPGKNRESTEKILGFPHPACGNVENLTAF